MEPRVDPMAVTDATTSRMVEVATTEFDGSSVDGKARAVVLGDLTVTRVEVQDTTSVPGVVGQRLSEAVNAALDAARKGALAAFMSIPGLDPALRAMLAGESEVPVDEVDSDVDPALLARDFAGTDGDVQVTVWGRTQQVTSIHLPDLDDETVARIPRAANRALAAAQLGRDGATPLGEQTDEILESLDEKMSAIESKLDGVEDILDALAQELGL